ncbi:uncharacterized protein EV422DRAFT_3723 [Fimicolochytrium jonesii]|uniref:uncharacterized protein n=1 Tax=Fimicolochytrium jonesii TaxID=1396493 RepID=UPI0022FDC800|nr:uncharacterized protein EV422DRAFT_3723 [Fimicolochytrium jonesii]KAI8826605.1 hypothetical protein EV422DRAFT_3723 [Fimicolochytrium jonesii]
MLDIIISILFCIIESLIRGTVANIASPLLSVYDTMSNKLSSAFSAALCIVGGPGPLEPHLPHRDRAILVTGTSAGIGRQAAWALASQGYTVFAGVRKLREGQELRHEFLNAQFRENIVAGPCPIGEIIPVVLEVTDKMSILTAKNTIENVLRGRGGKLVGVINVAGLIFLSPLETTDSSEVRRIFDVNFFGVLDVARTFLPLLKKSRGRIVNVGSAASFLVAPAAGIYSASKSAIGSATEALRMELANSHVGVSLIEPGAIRTRAWDVAVNTLPKYNADLQNGTAGASSGIGSDGVYTKATAEPFQIGEQDAIGPDGNDYPRKERKYSVDFAQCHLGCTNSGNGDGAQVCNRDASFGIFSHETVNSKNTDGTNDKHISGGAGNLQTANGKKPKKSKRGGARPAPIRASYGKHQPEAEPKCPILICPSSPRSPVGTLAESEQNATILWYAPLFNRLEIAYKAGILLAFPPKHVTQHVEHALMSRFPRDRYLAGADAKIADAILTFVPQKIVELAIRWFLW